MKIIELTPRFEKEEYFGWSAETKLLQRYIKQNEDVVVAYVKNCIGLIFLIKTKKKNGFMGYILTERRFRGYSLYRIGLIACNKLLNHPCEKDRLHIVDTDLWNRYEARLALMELDTTEKDKDYRGDGD